MKRNLDKVLKHLLLQSRSVIVEKWRNAIRSTYPEDSSRFLQKTRNRFSNPVGYTISTETDVLYEAVLEGVDRERVISSLDNILRIRAVQDFTPSEAVSFISHLKKLIRDELDYDLREKNLLESLGVVESRIDGILLLAFDVYMKCREDIAEIRLNSMKRQSSVLLERFDAGIKK